MPVFETEKSVVVAEPVELAISNSLVFVSPLLALIENFAYGVDVPTPTLPFATVHNCEPDKAPPLLYWNWPEAPPGPAVMPRDDVAVSVYPPAALPTKTFPKLGIELRPVPP